MMPLHTPGIISQISETVNEISAKKIRIIITFKIPDYPLLVFSPHTSTQNMQINHAHRDYYNGEKMIFYKLSGKNYIYCA
jgi:acyl-CoA hydrolase